MKTEISRFCGACLNSLTVLSPVLAHATQTAEHSHEKQLLLQPLARLNDVRARVRSLSEKLESQQAYLLIFGPLKSGKSTLMNAISGSYVSEVTSLPGYPCLVYVANSAEPRFSVTRYNGRETIFANGGVLNEVIADSHIALAEQIREAEKRGLAFDPREHFTEAIRRIDIKVPVQSLAESSTVLVDTPGLYSRMNFGYDVLTREFRNSAACAVFVVKTDNLFLEQVFAEFNQLLDLFSRIFLVINVDSNKRDLQSDGTLRQSTESAHPEKVIEAFRTLSMAGPLRQAYEAKRVRIHAVDLMNAASGILSRNSRQAGAADENSASLEAFSAFQRDLTDYLNSSDYTVEFIRDSLRQGSALCEEVRELYRGGELQQIGEKQRDLESEMIKLDDTIAAVDRLLEVDWSASFSHIRAENAERAQQSLETRRSQLSKEMRQALDEWYRTGESVQALAEQYWTPLLTAGAATLGDETRARLRELTGTPLGGSEPPALVMNDLHGVGLSLQQIAQGALPKLNQREELEPYRISINRDEVPVRKSFADWLLFRSRATVRLRLLGEDLSQAIPPAQKQARLSERTRDAFLQMIEEGLQQRIPTLPAQFTESLLTGYVHKFRTDLTDALRERREGLARRRAELQQPYDSNLQLLRALDQLDQTAERVAVTLREIAEQERALLGATDAGAAGAQSLNAS
jgi:signal recognition particle receptor subunit beta